MSSITVRYVHCLALTATSHSISVGPGVGVGVSTTSVVTSVIRSVNMAGRVRGVDGRVFGVAGYSHLLE